MSGYNGQGGSQTPKDVYKDLLAEEIEKGNGNIFMADTLEELAELAGIPAESLKETAARYTEAFKAGVDEDFQKDPKHLSSLEEGPYYRSIATTASSPRLAE